ncbi:hypothetical protein [Luteipulveratus flavus]|uniref:Uncharacterized protein n=1 Tax=Luteipulveratus flavus TaxID=3031728 RepID=A0ABT6C3J7_9MICO|nr:hypothetical protein [Luteipulveratus sp. YIM 133296]MDF8263536.1 hypothetical protein [Luteipulveratus sp. YIM 133296]
MIETYRQWIERHPVVAAFLVCPLACAVCYVAIDATGAFGHRGVLRSVVMGALTGVLVGALLLYGGYIRRQD